MMMNTVSESRRSPLPAKVIILALQLTLLLSAEKFYADDPLEEMPAPLSVRELKTRKLNDVYDLFENTLGEPGERQTKKEKGRGAATLIPSQAVNTLGEVPNDPAWFTNRIGSRPMSIEELVRGPGADRPPSTEGTWTVVGAKTSGVTPGFRIRDSTGQLYLLKFDPLTNPEMSTASDVIGAKFFHALGYSVPENYIVNFTPDQLTMGEMVVVFDPESGRDRPMTRRDLILLREKVARDERGRFRAVASRFLKGKCLGEFRYYGTRLDDFNDIVAHEHRRDLRGLFVFSAWLNHNDSRAIKNMDLLVEENGISFVKHYLIDFGAMFGSASVISNTARDGNAYLWELKPALAQIATLGIWSPRWMRDRYIKHPALGMIEYPSFEPEQWKPNYPNPAFQNRLPTDEFWAAKRVMAFSNEAISAIVKEAKFSDKYAEDLLTDYLIKRRDKIGEAYFAKLLPRDEFKVSEGRLEFEDLQVKYGLVDDRDYQVEWSSFDNRSKQHTAIAGETSLRLPDAALQAAESSFFAAKIQGEDENKTVVVYLRKDGGARTPGGGHRTRSQQPGRGDEGGGGRVGAMH